MKNFGKFLLGVVVGAITGATLATLLAPTSGSNLRARICENLTMIRSDVAQAAQQKKNELWADLARMQKKDLPL